MIKIAFVLIINNFIAFLYAHKGTKSFELPKKIKMAIRFLLLMNSLLLIYSTELICNPPEIVPRDNIRFLPAYQFLKYFFSIS
jgi:hypothetical protein